MGSTRLPGKVLLPLNNHTVIGEVLTRCKRIPGVDEVVCVIPIGDLELYREAGKYVHTRMGPGDENDVLSRYYYAAYARRADIIVRVTGDCPLISPELCGVVVAALKSSTADYASNVHPRSVPKGLDCEAFTFDALRYAQRDAEPHEREHVTTWMRRWPYIKKVTVDNFSLDTEDDYRTILAAFGERIQPAGSSDHLVAVVAGA